MLPEQGTLSLFSASRIRELTSGEDSSGLDAWLGCSSGISLLPEILGPIGVVPLLHLGKAGPALGKPRSPHAPSPAAISKDLILSLLCIYRVRDVF